MSVRDRSILNIPATDVESVLPNGFTLLHDCIVQKATEPALFLIRHGADVNRPTNEGAWPLEVRFLA